jgi:hypothetical protein
MQRKPFGGAFSSLHCRKGAFSCVGNVIGREQTCIRIFSYTLTCAYPLSWLNAFPSADYGWWGVRILASRHGNLSLSNQCCTTICATSASFESEYGRTASTRLPCSRRSYPSMQSPIYLSPMLYLAYSYVSWSSNELLLSLCC